MSNPKVKLAPPNLRYYLFLFIMNSTNCVCQPCCVCKEEKSVRDECMLFSNAKDPQKDCASTIDKYKICMAGFGFSLP